jgi:hypothetical protein
MSATIEQRVQTEQDQNLAELRAFLTPALRKHLEQRGSRRMLGVFTLLRRLRTDDLRTAMLCHRALLIETRDDIRAMGFIDLPWADLARLVFNLIDSQGHSWRSGRWEQDPVQWSR